MDLDEFREYVVGEVERCVDEQILREPDLNDRMLLMRNRGRIIDKMIDATMIANLKVRVTNLERRLHPRLVEG
jgi:hypothetical protein